MVTAQSAADQAARLLGYVKADGTINTSSNPLYYGLAIGYINSLQQELAPLCDMSTVDYITSLTDILSISDDMALRVMPWGIAMEIARMKNMSNSDLEYFTSKYREAKRNTRISVKPSTTVIHDDMMQGGY